MYQAAAEGDRTIPRIWHVTLDRLADDPLAGQVLRILAWYAPTRTPGPCWTAGRPARGAARGRHAGGPEACSQRSGLIYTGVSDEYRNRLLQRVLQERHADLRVEQ
jgi:hypothetical protein